MGTTRSRFLTGFAIPEAYFRCSESLRPWIFCNSRQGSWSSRQHDGALELPIPKRPKQGSPVQLKLRGRPHGLDLGGRRRLECHLALANN